jgi:methyl-accepting chemotaxis protein
LKAFETAMNAWTAASEPIIKSTSANQDWDGQYGLFLDAREHLNSMEDIMDAYAEYQSAYMLGKVDAQVRGVLVVIILILIISTVFNVLVIRYMRVSVQTVKDTINTIADNDLTQAPPTSDSKDEFGDLLGAASRLYESLREVVGHINESSERVAAAGRTILDTANDANEQVENINTAINDMAITANQQANDITNIATNMTEIGELVQESGRFSENLAEASNQIDGVTKEGMEVVTELLHTTDETMSAFEDIFDLVNNISGSVLKIGEASRLISDIASQTNLLSLNASIEAARAGEAGRGFAVVAGEISNLADQSAQSANTINQMIEELQKAAELAANQGEEVKRYVDAQNQSVRKTQEKFENIVASVKEMDNGIKNIASVNKEMGHNFTNVNDLISSLSASSEENAANSEQIAATTETVGVSMENVNDSSRAINGEAEALVEAVEIFRL